MFQFTHVMRALMIMTLSCSSPLFGAQNPPPRPPRPVNPPPAPARPPVPRVRAAAPAIPAAALPVNPSPGASQPAGAAAPYTNDSTKSPILVLSIDGAAVRGIAQFALLQAIEKGVNEEIMRLGAAASIMKVGANFPWLKITDIFDVFAGTSAGSINVGAILIPKDPLTSNTRGVKTEPKFTLSDLKDRLPDTLKAAFASSFLRKVRTLKGVLGTKFTAKPIEALLQDYTTIKYIYVDGEPRLLDTFQKPTNVRGEAQIPGQAGAAAGELIVEPRMSDLVKPAVITSYDFRAREVFNFSTYEACKITTKDPTVPPKSSDEQDYLLPKDDSGFVWKDTNVKLWQAMRASSAAPTFFKPLELRLRGRDRALIDAGLFVMSPTLLGWLEAQRLYPNRPMVIISISSGTLTQAREVQTKGATAGSVLKVIRPTIETALEGEQALIDLIMREMPYIVYYGRASFAVTNTEFDDTSEANIKALEDAPKETVASSQFKEMIQQIVAALIARKKKLAANPNDFTPFVCQAKDVQKKNMGGVLHGREVLAVIEMVKAYRTKNVKVPDALRQKLTSIQTQCGALSGPRKKQEWLDMKCDAAAAQLG